MEEFEAFVKVLDKIMDTVGSINANKYKREFWNGVQLIKTEPAGFERKIVFSVKLPEWKKNETEEDAKAKREEENEHYRLFKKQ